MATSDKTRQKIKAKLSAIRRIKDNPNSIADHTYDAYKDDLSSVNGIVKKSVNNFTSKVKGATQNKKNIFEELTNTIENVLGTNRNNTKPFDPKEKPIIKKRLVKYSKDSAQKALLSSRQIMVDETKKVFFAGVGSCDPNTIIGTNVIELSPKSFDFLDVLKVDPDSVSGRMIYESTTTSNGVKFNRELFNSFDSVTPYDFVSGNGDTLFSLLWNNSTQVYSISGLTSTMKISEFLTDYYNSIEYPDIDGVIKNAMLMTFQGDESDPISFKNGQAYLDRLTTKLFSICGKPKSAQPLLNNATDELTDDEVNLQDYFDFDDVEGIDLEDEDARKKRVLKFRDCNNFELPINPNHMEDFAYLLDKKTIDENVNNTINKVVSEAYEQSGNNMPSDLFQISITGSYILKIPKALISTILSPKMIYPIAASYKIIKNEDISVKDLFRKLYKLFYNIIVEHFWRFIKEFWTFVKKDLLIFLKEVASSILSEKLQKVKDIITSLISFLRQAVQSGGIQSCTEIFNAILKTIDLALNRSINIPIPGLLLLMSKRLPGFSSNRVFIDMMERAEAAGINTGPIYGTENKLPTLMKSMSDSIAKGLMDTKVQGVLEGGIIPSGPGGAVIPPGTLLVTGIIV